MSACWRTPEAHRWHSWSGWRWRRNRGAAQAWPASALASIADGGPERRGRRSVEVRDRYPRPKLISEFPIHAYADRQPWRGVVNEIDLWCQTRRCTTRRIYVLWFDDHHIKWLAEPSAEPNKFVTRLTSRMVSMGGHGIAVGVVKNDHAPRAFERQRADKFHQTGKFGQLGARRP